MVTKVSLVQLNPAFDGALYLPLSAGSLQSYVMNKNRYRHAIEFMPLHVFFGDPVVAAQSLKSADIVGFSVYVWNFNNCVEIAKELKRIKPEIVLIFGGPHVPDDRKAFTRIKKRLEGVSVSNKTEEFHRKFPFVDIAVHGEGELVFNELVEVLIENKYKVGEYLKKVNSISYLLDNHFYHNEKRDRLRELTDLPSPFLDGVFDELMSVDQGFSWMAMWETDRGCPYQCTYCDWGGATEDKISEFVLEKIKEEALWFGKNKISYVFIANANFGILKRDVEIAKYLAISKEKYGYPETVSVQNAKNPKKHSLDALKILDDSGLSKATVMSIQSKNADTLKAVRRDNMKTEEYEKIQAKLRSEGIATLTDYIIPMPHETLKTFKDGLLEIIVNGQHNRIQINNLSLLPNAEMSQMDYRNRYAFDTIFIPIVNKHGKKIINSKVPLEFQEMVIATNTMARDEWKKAQIFGYMTSLLYFNKLMQIPLFVALKQDASYFIPFFDYLMKKGEENSADYPVLRYVVEFFDAHLSNMIANSESEFYYSEAHLGIFWPPDEFIFIDLVEKNKLNNFLDEVYSLLCEFICKYKFIEYEYIQDAYNANLQLIRLPMQQGDISLVTKTNVLDFYMAALTNHNFGLTSTQKSYNVIRSSVDSQFQTALHVLPYKSIDDWCTRMVWWRNRSGGYLYDFKSVS
jgi:radical SAM superfamily enzyme YgiQ (UPF0313 family)